MVEHDCEVCLSALRVIDRRPSTSSGLTDVGVRGMKDINPRSATATTATKPVRPEPVEGLSLLRETEQGSNTLTSKIFNPNSLLTGVSD